ncbi:TolC family protein [Francisella sciaenopsi]|uniref:TolC family protein SilC n=1 Tax=Francisella sciaenopsi TaxID=3055034 RepID=A0ABQ6PF96_9GAMM
MKKILISLSTVLAVSFISSCSFFNPKYDKPEIKTPELWHSQQTIKTNDIDLTNLAWWRQFHDPTLNSLIDTALRDNNQLQVAIGSIVEAQTEIDKANYGWLPTASVGGGGVIGQTFGTNYSSSVPNLNMPQSATFGGGAAGILPSYTINIVRQFKLGEISRLSKKMQLNAKNAIRMSIISQVVATYFSLLMANQQLELQQEMVNKLDTLYVFYKREHEVGSDSAFSQHFLKQQLESQKGKIATIKNDIVHLQNSLRILTNKNPGDVSSYRKISDINANVEVPINLPSQVLLNRPDVAIAEYKLQSANANIGLARSQFFPSIDLTGTFGNATLALGQLATFNAWAWAAQAASTVPIFNLSILADTNKAKAQFYQGYYDYIDTLRKAFKDVDNSLSEHTAYLNNLDKQKNALEAVYLQNKLYAKKFEVGDVSKADTVAISLNVINQEMEANQAKLNTLVSIVNLYQALGSGYNVDNYNKPDYSNPAFNK